jgi:hypothetical protein
VSSVSVADLTPNVGFSWYFFIEMFDHFRSFFLAVFQLHLVAYVAPVCIKLKWVIRLLTHIQAEANTRVSFWFG